MILIVAIVLALVFALTLPGFATVGNLLTLARSVSVLGILGLAMALVVIGRGLDLSLIAAMAAGSAAVIQALNAGLPVPVALLIGLAVVLAIGFVNGWVIAFVEVPALFTTLATAFLIFGLTRFVLKTVIVYPPPTATAFLYLGQGRPLGIPMPIIMFAAVAVLVHLFLSRTRAGRFIYARGDNTEAARLTGVDVRRDIIVSYMLAAAIGFLAGIVSSASTASMNMQIINSTLIFDVVLVVVLGGVSLVGGRGSVLSVLVGTLLIGVLLNGLTIMNVNGQVQDIIRGLVLLGAIILDNRLHPRDEETARQGD
ncbi:ABC transporter permease [Chelatococcus reniformis]|uniref:ABC transporter permease n=1 Tax=Chelatococcus reniformis TaxID=1494448 RepID=A0A916X7U9_9HYPH|nr:ABC transporter permease [Chelatococcus reniformis]